MKIWSDHAQTGIFKIMISCDIIYNLLNNYKTIINKWKYDYYKIYDKFKKVQCWKLQPVLRDNSGSN